MTNATTTRAKASRKADGAKGALIEQTNEQTNEGTTGATDELGAYGGGDPELEALVRQVEKAATKPAVNLVDLIDADTVGVLVLFPYVPARMEAGKVYPILKGHLETRRVRVPVSCFESMTEEGRTYAGMSIGGRDQDHIGGALFRQETQDERSGRWSLVPGKENDRYGVITKSVKVAGTEDYENVFTLRFSGKRKISGGGVPYIRARVFPERKPGEASDAAFDGCF